MKKILAVLIFALNLAFASADTIKVWYFGLGNDPIVYVNAKTVLLSSDKISFTDNLGFEHVICFIPYEVIK